MHLRKYILATLLIFVLASCYREQDLDQYRNDELSNMLTLNSLVSADSTVQVAATKPYFFSDVHKGRTFVTDLDIAVSINGEEKEHMTYDADRHLYVSNTKVIPGESVTVSTRYRDKTVKATDVMPEPVVIEGITVSRQGPMQIYTDADCVVYYNLTFTDKPGDSYYFLQWDNADGLRGSRWANATSRTNTYSNSLPTRFILRCLVGSHIRHTACLSPTRVSTGKSAPSK